MSNRNILEIRHLSKSFIWQPVLQDVTMEIPEGCIYGLLGPNGAGKSTLLKMMTGILRPGAILAKDLPKKICGTQTRSFTAEMPAAMEEAIREWGFLSQNSFWRNRVDFLYIKTVWMGWGRRYRCGSRADSGSTLKKAIIR